MTSTGLMHNPPHPGEFIRDVYLGALQVRVRDVASRLQVAPSTLNRILQRRSRVTPEMALRLSRCLGRSAESWLAMQAAHDLWQARQHLDLSKLEPVTPPAN
jgi:addiction module HigA family antidote